jgi:hypothetical protein
MFIFWHKVRVILKIACLVEPKAESFFDLFEFIAFWLSRKHKA